MADDATVVVMPTAHETDQVPEMVKVPTPIASPRVDQPTEKASREHTPRSATGTPRQESTNATPRRCDADAGFDEEDESLMPGRHEPSFRYSSCALRLQHPLQMWLLMGAPPSPLLVC